MSTPGSEPAAVSGDGAAAGRRPGLRERKKARTRATIQDKALRLFAEHGYDGTTVEQIAEAAEVSPSTFFRYFPTKEDVVAYDRLDPAMMRIFVAQPPELDLVTAMKNAVHEVFGHLDVAQTELEQVRGRLTVTVPALRARLGESMIAGITMLADAIAARTGRPADSDEVLVSAGAVGGAIVALSWSALATEHLDFVDAVDRALDLLRDGPDLRPVPAAHDQRAYTTSERATSNPKRR